MLTYWALRVAFAITRYVPLPWLYHLGRLGGEAAYWCWPAKRRHTRRNMAAVSSETEQGQRAAALARASWRNYGTYLVDFLNLPNVPPAEIFRRTHVQGWEHLERALEAGKGVIFVTGHFGIWDYSPATLAVRYPGRVHVVAESFESTRVEGIVKGHRTAQGATIIPMTNVRQMLRVLKNNDILGLLVDRPCEQGDGVPITFFGRPATVPAGAATLAALTGAALLPGYVFHREGGDYEGGILAAVEPARTGNRAADVRQMTQGIFSALEGIITPRPQHWYMFRDFWPTFAPAPGETETATQAGATA